MKKITLLIAIFYLSLLSSCILSSNETREPTSSIPATFRATVTNALSLQTPPYEGTPLPTLALTATQPPLEVINDIFLPNYGEVNMEQGVFLIQERERKLSVLDAEITSNCKHTGQYGLHITYVMSNEYTSGNYGGWHISVVQGAHQYPRIDIRNSKTIDFWVIGKVGAEIFEIWITNEFDSEIGVKSIDYVEISSTEWQMVHIPFSDFYRTRPFNEIYGIAFIFRSTSGVGEICIDDISVINP